jgi:hypothetical protein
VVARDVVARDVVARDVVGCGVVGCGVVGCGARMLKNPLPMLRGPQHERFRSPYLLLFSAHPEALEGCSASFSAAG